LFSREKGRNPRGLVAWGGESIINHFLLLVPYVSDGELVGRKRERGDMCHHISGKSELWMDSW